MVTVKIDPMDGASPKEKTRTDNIPPAARPHSTGIGGANYPEALPAYEKADCETVYKGKNDSYIVLGRDRTGTKLQGYGMNAEAKCSSIDIVAGRWSGLVPKISATGEENKVNPSFLMDAARIYISQRTDVDAAFECAPGKVGNHEDRSAIAIKADGVRIMAREGIKLITGIDPFNSKNIEITEYGIDLIAMNMDYDIQPLVKGRNLEMCLKRLWYHVDSLAEVVQNFCSHQIKFNRIVQEHTHISPFDADDTAPNINLESGDGPAVIKDIFQDASKQLTVVQENLGKWKAKYLDKVGFDGKPSKFYINSKYNNTN